MATPTLTPLLRRVLASLPAWAEDEEWVIAEEGGPEHSVRSHSLAEMHAQLAVNPHAQLRDEETGEDRPMSEDEVAQCLAYLKDAGWASCDEEGQWRMTEEGFAAIHAPEENINQLPGPVEISPDPAVVGSSASMEDQ